MIPNFGSDCYANSSFSLPASTEGAQNIIVIVGPDRMCGYCGVVFAMPSSCREELL